MPILSEKILNTDTSHDAKYAIHPTYCAIQ